MLVLVTYYGYAQETRPAGNTGTGFFVKNVSSNGLIDISDLAKGIYLVKVKSKVLKLIKE